MKLRRKDLTRGILLILLSGDNVNALFSGTINISGLVGLVMVLILLILSVGDDISADNRIARLEKQVEVSKKTPL